MEARASNWAALLGEWQFRGGSATYRGNEDPKAPVGLAVTNLLFREGTLSARATLPHVHDQARLVFGMDTRREHQYSIGIGGAIAYFLDDFDIQRGSVTLQAWGPPSGLSAGAHAITVSLRGQSLDFWVDDVLIFGTNLPRPLRGEQVGVLAVGEGVKFDSVEIAERVLPRAFIVMPFRPALDDLYEQSIAPICRESGLEPIRADEFRYPGVILQDIVRGLREASAVVAEISADDNNAFNANVFYELGYAHATGKPTILLARRGTDLPFDISGYRVILYDDTIGGKPAVERELRTHLQNILGVPLAEHD